MRLIEITESVKLQTSYKGIIYLIVNNINGKTYVGQTINSFRDRYSAGRWFDLTENECLQNSVKKHGKENFQIFIIEHGKNQKELNQLESEYIQKLDTISPNGFNFESGGNAKTLHPRTKTLLSKIRRGKYSPKNKASSKYLGVRFVKSTGKYMMCIENQKLNKRKYCENEIEAAELRDKIVLYLFGEDDCILNFPEKKSYYLSLDLEEEYKMLFQPKSRKGCYRNATVLPPKEKLLKMILKMEAKHLAQIFGLSTTGMLKRLRDLDIAPYQVRGRLDSQKAQRFFERYMKFFNHLSRNKSFR